MSDYYHFDAFVGYELPLDDVYKAFKTASFDEGFQYTVGERVFDERDGDFSYEELIDAIAGPYKGYCPSGEQHTVIFYAESRPIVFAQDLESEGDSFCCGEKQITQRITCGSNIPYDEIPTKEQLDELANHLKSFGLKPGKPEIVMSVSII